MHLVAKCVEGVLPPNVLPVELTKGRIGAPELPIPAPSIAPLIASGTDGTTKIAAPPTLPWVVSAAEKARYDEMFRAADLDKDGFVSGTEIKDVFLKSGLPQPVLAHIW
jgi:epidermal growth factor receptor substrate 15